MWWKYLFLTAIIVGAGSMGYLFMRTGNTPDEPAIDSYAIDDEVKSLENTIQEEDTEQNKATGNYAGSCNAVATDGVCIELVGSAYLDGNMGAMACADTGVFTGDPCPTSPYGGCRTGAGTNVEMISFMYPNAENEIDDQSIKYAQMACEANGLGEWVTN